MEGERRTTEKAAVLHGTRAAGRAVGVATLILCCAWIGGAAVARPIAERNITGVSGTTGTSPVLIGGSLIAAAVVLSGVAGLGGTTAAGLVFAVTVAGLAADGRLVDWDAVGAFLALSGVVLSGSAGSRWGGLLLLGLACGCSPLCAGGVVTLAFARAPWRSRVVHMVAVVVIGWACVEIIEAATGRGVQVALAAGPEAARMGTHDVWRLVARWGDLVLGATIFGALAAATWFWTGRDAGGGPMLNRFENALVGWAIVNVLAGLILPRLVFDHGLLLVLPCFLLVPAGRRLLHTLPLDRTQWTLSLFTVGCHVLPFALLWYPLRKVLEVGIVALYPP